MCASSGRDKYSTGSTAPWPSSTRSGASGTTTPPPTTTRPGIAPPSAAVQAAWTAALEALLPPAPARVLDCGAGTGFLSLIAARLGHRVTALDLSPGMLAKLPRRGGGRGASTSPWWPAPPHEPPPGFDVVIERHLLWTLPDPAAALAAWRAGRTGREARGHRVDVGRCRSRRDRCAPGPGGRCGAGVAPPPITTGPIRPRCGARCLSDRAPIPAPWPAGGRGGMVGPAPGAPARRGVGLDPRAAPSRAAPRRDAPVRRRGDLSPPGELGARPGVASAVSPVPGPRQGWDRWATNALERGVAHRTVHRLDDRARGVDEHGAGIADQREPRAPGRCRRWPPPRTTRRWSGRRPGRWRDRRCRRLRRRPRRRRPPAPGGPRGPPWAARRDTACTTTRRT